MVKKIFTSLICFISLQAVGQNTYLDEIQLMDYFRKESDHVIDGEKVIIREDYSVSQSINLTNQEIKTIHLPKSNVIGFFFYIKNLLYFLFHFISVTLIHYY